ncbi:MAG: hypothetical protein JNN10_09370 [Sphingopyxis sp.]|uniref:hypothetical protein n=1 Tax=Sphingopyxis sp. TaxID=1908224 RepID=UPI001A400528|nr:hypothetical protein [Sphingopyxis sp.]MBL9066488.1 hypothetical protein [Sphingopyxis sp.]
MMLAGSLRTRRDLVAECDRQLAELEQERAKAPTAFQPSIDREAAQVRAVKDAIERDMEERP